MKKEEGRWAAKAGLKKVGQAAWRRWDISKTWGCEVSQADMGDDYAMKEADVVETSWWSVPHLRKTKETNVTGVWTTRVDHGVRSWHSPVGHCQGLYSHMRLGRELWDGSESCSHSLEKDWKCSLFCCIENRWKQVKATRREPVRGQHSNSAKSTPCAEIFASSPSKTLPVRGQSWCSLSGSLLSINHLAGPSPKGLVSNHRLDVNWLWDLVRKEGFHFAWTPVFHCP